MSSSKRHFTAVVGSKEHGLYISSSPSSAARKIVSKLCAASKSKKVEFCVREITQGSKKKTYGPYLGEMKKLAKPIELNGRVIRYAPVVHLKKKKIAIKTGKKIGKKMRGGDIDVDGELTPNDFLIKYSYETKNISNGYRMGTMGYEVLKNNLDISKITPRLTRKNDIFDEPFIFFCPKIINNHLNIHIQTTNMITYHHNLPIMYYEYVAFNEGRFSKKAIFKKLGYIIRLNSSYDKNIEDVDNISDIPKEALIKLRDFIIKQRQQDPTFCKTIYNAVVAVVGPPQKRNNQ